MKKLEDVAAIQECSFQPKIKRKSNSPVRSINEFVKDQEQYDSHKMKKIKDMSHNTISNLSQGMEGSKMNEKSRILAQRVERHNSQQKTYDNLY